MSTQSAYERRVTLALKWHHLENLSNGEIRQRFIDEGHGEFTPDTISRYLNSKPAEEVMEQIHNEQAHVREQSAERFERKYERARQAEARATRDEPIIAIRPNTARNRNEFPIDVSDWRVLDASDPTFPEWATDRDTIIEFIDGTRSIEVGQQYYPKNPAGEPEYHKEVVGLRRDQPDLNQQRAQRYEQLKHQAEKAEVLGAYEEQHHHTHEGSIAVGELSAEQEETFEELTGAPGSDQGSDEGPESGQHNDDD